MRNKRQSLAQWRESPALWEKPFSRCKQDDGTNERRSDGYCSYIMQVLSLGKVWKLPGSFQEAMRVHLETQHKQSQYELAYAVAKTPPGPQERRFHGATAQSQGRESLHKIKVSGTQNLMPGLAGWREVPCRYGATRLVVSWWSSNFLQRKNTE
jgi:hypothetical protein